MRPDDKTNLIETLKKIHKGETITMVGNGAND